MSKPVRNVGAYTFLNFAALHQRLYNIK